MAGKTAAFAGASGIGKSTLLNRLFPHLELSTSDISRKIERGRHTTREAVLFEISDAADCGYIADTPGFSMLDFKRFDFFEKDDLVHTMREFESYIGECRYTKCSHTKEQGCAVIEAVKKGVIPKSRHESYVELYDILKTRKKWE
jgi:ribosome biogenesis GTPase